jgi:prepilin-type N-terminal cleavage/methylation domain-containing protein
MKSRRGFTLIELMVVVLIVAVLAALIVPLMTSRFEAARWSEGKAGAGTIATALRAYIAEQGEEGVAIPGTIPIATFMTEAELTGKYFKSSDYDDVTNVSYTPGVIGPGMYQLTYTITVNPGSVNPTLTWQKTGYTLDHTGAWVEL